MLPRALRHVTLVTAAGRSEHTARGVAAVPAVGRLVWTLAAFALHCDRPAALVALARARIRVPFDDNVTSVIALITFRHPDAFAQDAGVAFNDYHDWLSALDLLEHCPLFRADLDAALLEADLVLAMCTARYRTRIYARGHARDTVRRLTARVADTTQRRTLEERFPGEGELEERLERASAAVEGDRDRFERGPASMFSGEG